MRWTLVTFRTLVLIPRPLLADLRATVDLLDPSDGGPQPPAGVLVLDVLVDTDSGDAWLASAIAADTIGSSTFIYDGSDPEDPLINPGAANRFVSCVSVPLPRLGTLRFDACRATIYGSECPLDNREYAEPSHFSATWIDEQSLPCAERPSVSGAIARIAVALDPALICTGDVSCCFAVYSVDDVPSEAIPVLQANCSDDELPHGILWGTCDRPQLTSLSWVLAQTPTAGSCRFDLNRDRTIDIEDLAIVLAAFGAIDGQSEFNVHVDFDANGRVELQDLATFVANWGAF